jgi:colanic acid biosynthesis glycosyl transferase WcaI
MRVLIVSQVFPPESPPTAIMVEDLARYLASQGHHVTVAAGHPHHPHGRLPDGWQRPLISKTMDGGFVVLRGWHPVSPNKSFGIRGLILACQSVGTAAAALAAERPDVVITFGLPLIGPLLSAAVARRFGAATITVISDIYPDAAIETGRLTNGLLIRASRAAETLMYRSSDRIVVLSAGFQRTLIARGVSPTKLTVIPVWLGEAEAEPEGAPDWREMNAVAANRRVVLYAGTVGLVHGLDVIIETAVRLRHAPEVLLLVVGEGNAKRDLEHAARGMENIRFMSFQPREDVGRMLASADLCLVTLAPGSGRVSVPSKVIAYLAAGKPIVASVDTDSDTSAMIQDSGAGWVVKPGDPEQLADAIDHALASTHELSRRGEAGRAWFLKHHTKRTVLDKYEQLVLEVQRRNQS